jgi:hypothetical protein
VTIISPEHLDDVFTGNVLIEDGRIVRIERGHRDGAPRGATVMSGKGKFLVPGLMDSHVHLAGIPGVDQYSRDHQPQPEVIRQYFEQLPRSYLYFAFTTLVDLAIMDRNVLNDFRKTPPHPDLYDCGPSLPMANGYPMQFFPVEKRFELFPNSLFDPQHAIQVPAGYDPNQHTPPVVVAAVKNSGGICVKTYFERHNWLPLIPTHPPPRPLAIGITGWRRATASEPRRPARYYAALPKAHKQLQSKYGIQRAVLVVRCMKGVAPPFLPGTQVPLVVGVNQTTITKSVVTALTA